MDNLDNHRIVDFGQGVVPKEDILVSIYSEVATVRTVLEDSASGREKESVLNDGLLDYSRKKGDMMSKSWRRDVGCGHHSGRYPSSVPTLSLIPSCLLG